MRRLLTWLLVTLGAAALVRRLRRRRANETEPYVPESDPADELRQKLAESRTADEQAPEAAAEPAAAEATVEERRSEIHAQGRSTVDEMRDADEM